MKILLIALLSLISLNSLLAQDHKIVIQSDTLVYLMNDETIMDSIKTRNYFKPNQYIKKVNENKIYVLKAVIPTVGNLDGAYNRIEEYTVKDNEFVLKHSFDVHNNNCPDKILKLKFLNSGIMWKFKIGLFKSKKGIIPYNDYKRLKQFTIDCNAIN